MSSRVVLPVVDLEQNANPLRKTVLKGAKQVQIQRIASNFTTENSTQFIIQPPSINTIMDRRIDLEMEIELNADTTSTVAFQTTDGATKNCFYDRFDSVASAPFPNTAIAVANGANADYGAGNTPALINTGVNTQLTKVNTALASVVANGVAAGRAQAQLAQNVRDAVDNNLAFRQFPLASCIDNIDVVINGTHFSSNLNDYFQALMTYTSPEHRQQVLYESAHHPDNYCGVSAATYEDSVGTNEHPLSTEDSCRAGEDGRGKCFAVVSEDRPANGAATVKVRLSEPLFIRPLLMAYGKGMTNINEIQVVINWNSNATSKMISLFECAKSNPTNSLPIATFKASLPTASQNANVVMRYYTAQDDIVIPNDLIVPVQTPQYFVEAVAGTLAKNAVKNDFLSKSQRLTQVPDCVYIWAERTKAETTAAAGASLPKPWNCANIQKLNITFKNQTGILSGATLRDGSKVNKQLLELATENGLDCRSLVEAQQQGKVIKLEFGKDIPLDDNEAPGTRGDYTINFQLDYQNLSADTTTFDFKCVYMLNGMVVISPNEVKYQDGLLSVQDNITAEDMGHKHSDQSHHGLYGAGLWSSLKKFGSKASHMAKTALKHKDDIMGAYQGIKGAVGAARQGDFSGVMGAGQQALATARNVRASARGGSMVGGSMVGGSAVGGSYVGGSRRM